jgi:predicted RNA-binding protein with PUA-like domain
MDTDKHRFSGTALLLSVCIRVHPWFNFGMNYWLVKSEPEAYAWSQLVKDGKTAWTGVRNYTARNNLRAMKKGDAVFFYHSVTDKQVVGLARVAKEAYPDATATEGDWSCVDLEPVKPLKSPVTLETIKADAVLKTMPLVKQSRLSVSPLTPAQAERMLKLAAG